VTRASLLARRLERCASIADLRSLAERRLPRALFDFVDGAAGAERTLRDNERAFSALRLAPRYGVDVSSRASATDLLGFRASMPLAFAPVGFAGLLWPHGEAAAARVAAEAGLPFCLSTNSNASLEDVARAAGDGERWFQLYFLRDREWMNGLVERARRAGYRGLCVTVDLPIAGRRARDIRNGFSVPIRMSLSNAMHLASKPAWLIGAAGRKVRIGNFEGSANVSGFASIAEHVAGLFDASATWDDVARLRERWRGPFLVKGVLHPDDARRALALGADAIVVSNHGARQLEDAPASLDVLPSVREAVGDRAPILVDGGVRRGVEIVKALALGASGCLIGRAYAYGLAAGGAAGVAKALSILMAEFDTALALLGVKSPDEIGPRHLWKASPGETAS
jgi:isopentenyl diphosphate isomerase/L-lactate dehydrogenase-like FMN-dependent dehydrogenase